MKKSILLVSLTIMALNVLGMEHKNQESRSTTRESIPSVLVQNNDLNTAIQNQMSNVINNQLFNRVIMSVIQENQVHIQDTAQLIGLCKEGMYLSDSILNFFYKAINSLNAVFDLYNEAIYNGKTNSEIQALLHQILVIQNDIIKGVPQFVSGLINQIKKLEMESFLDSTKTGEAKKNVESKIILLNQILWNAFDINQSLIIKDTILLDSFFVKVEDLNDSKLDLLKFRVDILNDSMFECQKSFNLSGKDQQYDQFFSILKEKRQHIADLQMAIIGESENMSDILKQVSHMLNKTSEISQKDGSCFEQLVKEIFQVSCGEDRLYFAQEIDQVGQSDQVPSESVRGQDGRDQASTSTAVYDEALGRYVESNRKFKRWDKKDKGKRPADDSEDEDASYHQPKKRKI